jgi:starch phosphorylase
MEIGLESRIPTYSGGLGVLAGDTLRAAADLGLPVVAVTLVHRGGYFRQRLDAAGVQTEEPVAWEPESVLRVLPARVVVEIEGTPVHVRAWRYDVRGMAGLVPVYLLDTSLPENPESYRSITDRLYGGDERLRLQQEAVLGLGGIALLRALGHASVTTYHMNEGHSALLTLALLREEAARDRLPVSHRHVVGRVARHCVFTTHTPVPAGHDRFPEPLVREVLGAEATEALREIGALNGGELNMTWLALAHARFVNGVAMRHREISRDMFPEHRINAITNGVHAVTWAAPSLQALFDRYIPEWRTENFNLRYIVGVPEADVGAAHLEAKQRLLAEVQRRTGRLLRQDVFTLGAARRATAYKRADLLFTDLDRLRAIAAARGGLQILLAGKAHPRDDGGKDIIRRIFAAADALAAEVPVVWLEDYDMELGGLLTAGVDLWLNTPLKPHEASGTSGMKAALNGVPSLSVLDGWWIEGHLEGITGWSVGDGWYGESDAAAEAVIVYDKLQHVILPLYHDDPPAYWRVMRAAIAFNGSFFTAERMLLQYAKSVYRLGSGAGVAPSMVAPPIGPETS